jgi:predicted nuclease with TOPRIM domain
LIAEQVHQIYPELVIYDSQGKIESVRYQELIPMLLNELQHQHSELNRQHRDLVELRADNVILRSTLHQVQGRVAQIATRMPELARR